MISEQVPSINCGMRGLAYLEIKVTGPDKDLHSGHYGGAVANPINILCDMISSLIDKDGHITVKGFYDDVVELSAEDREKLARAPFDLGEYKKFLDIGDVKGEKGYTTLERTGIRPCLDVNGIWGGYTGEGAKTVIPSEAHAKISMRLVPDQDSEKIAGLFEKHIMSIAPDCVKVEVTRHHGGNGFPHPDIFACIPGCIQGHGGSLRGGAGPEPRRRQHPDTCRPSEDTRHRPSADGLRPRARHHPFPGRELPAQPVFQGD